jgi:hypothetical protein
MARSTHQAQALSPSTRPLALAIDRWIFVFMAVLFIAITLTGFIPDSLMKIGMVQAGARPPFPLVMHLHAVLMGSFLLLLLAQAGLMATGRRDRHMWLGRAAFVIVPAIVVVGFLLVPTIYQQVWQGAQTAPPPIAEKLRQTLHLLDDIALLQMRVGFTFPICIALALRARRADADFHKRMMFLAVATALPAAIDRITWLPSTFPGSPLSTDLYMLLAVSPMFLWDLIRHRQALRVYATWAAVMLPFAIAVYLLWDTAGWHAFVPTLLL